MTNGTRGSRKDNDMAFGFRGAGFKGRLGADPVVDTAKGAARLRVAVDQGREFTEWVDLDVFGKSFEYIQKFSKGDIVHVCSSVITTRDGDNGRKFVNVTCSTADVELEQKREKGAQDKDLPF